MEFCGLLCSKAMQIGKLRQALIIVIHEFSIGIHELRALFHEWRVCIFKSFALGIGAEILHSRLKQ